MLGAGAAYGMANKGKPKPALSSWRKKTLIVLGCILGFCVLLLVAVFMIAPHPPSQ
jgi:hypothetical protein